MTPSILTENYDLNLGGPRRYEAWFDCGGETPVCVVVGQKKLDHKLMRWLASAYMATPAWLTGQSNDMQHLLSLAKSDSTVRDATAEWEEDDYLTACRDDANLLAERATLILGAVRTNGASKKR